jgi:hypothetical protein
MKELDKEEVAGRGVKISHKIPTEDFVKILERRPSQITIPASILKQSKGLRLMVKAMETFYEAERMPDIMIVQRGARPRIIRQDWLDPYIRGLVGSKPDVDDRLLIELLDVNATSPKTSMPLSELTPAELKLLQQMKEKGWVAVTDDLRVHLTKLGATIAKGAKKIYA